MRIIALFIFSFIGFSSIKGQVAVCGFDRLHQQQMTSSENQALVNQINSAITIKQNSLRLRRSVRQQTMDVYEIPLVVHVVHSGEAIGSQYNPSDATIREMIDFVNRTYSGEAGGNGVNIPIRFKLAQRAPDCSATNGIVRVDGSVIAGYAQNGLVYSGDFLGASDLALKNLSRWPNTEYYNIWIVKDIKAEGLPPNTYIAAYAYFPGASASRDGAVLRYNTVNATSATLPHELGHAFALYHTFDDGKDEDTCANNTDCTQQGDRVCDTDPHLSMIGTCPSPTDINPCTEMPFGLLPYNIMNYGNCRNQFTQGQADRALAALLTSRESLIYSQGGNAPIGSTAKSTCTAFLDVVQSRNAADIGPRTVEIAGQLYNSSNGYSKDGYISYIDNSCKKEARMDVSDSYILNISTSPNRQRVKVWIDWNNSGSFDSTELVMNSISATGNFVHSDTLTPLMMSKAIINTPLRMRVAADFYDSPDYTACAQLQFGQMEDYTVILSSTIPVRFGSITASKTVNNTLEVNWSTISELNTSFFELQMSNDGQHFKTVGKVSSKGDVGNSIEVLSYTDSINYAGSGILGLLGIALSGLALFSKRKWLYMSLLCLGVLYLACNKKDHTDTPPADLYFRVAHVNTSQTITYSPVIKVDNPQ